MIKKILNWLLRRKKRPSIYYSHEMIAAIKANKRLSAFMGKVDLPAGTSNQIKFYSYIPESSASDCRKKENK